MKLKQIISPRSNRKLVRQFGGAKLVRHHNGQHELVGGSRSDRTSAIEWASLFAHEVVFNG